MISAFGVEHQGEISKGWGGDAAARTANTARKAAIKGRLAERKALKSVSSSDRKLFRRLDAEDDYANRSHRKSVNFVERYNFNPKEGVRNLPKEGLKTSPPRGRSLTSSDKRYLGLPGGEKAFGTRQGIGPNALSGEGHIKYPFNGNKRVRKSLLAKADKHRHGNPYLTGVLAAGAAATVMGRGRANTWGGKIAGRTQGHAQWSSNRTRFMKNPTLKSTRRKYADKLNSLGQEMGRSNDTKEVTGRATTALGAGTLAGGVTAGRNRMKDKR